MLDDISRTVEDRG